MNDDNGKRRDPAHPIQSYEFSGVLIPRRHRATFLSASRHRFAAELWAISEVIIFLNGLEDLAAPREPGKVVYSLHEVLLICLLGCRAERNVW